MTKKIRIFFFMIISIFSVGIGFADVIKPDLHYVDRCIKISNPHGIPGYKLIVRYYELSLGQTSYGVYEVKENKCLGLSPRTERAEEILFLIDENIDLSTLDNLPLYDFHRKLGKNFIRLDDINLNLGYVSDPNLIKNEIITYKLVGNGNFLKIERIDDEEGEKEIEDEKNYTLEIVETEQGIELASEDRLIKFGIAWIITIFIETIVLFAIAKLFRKEDQISNGRLLLIGILASTITLPLLRFVLPLFVIDETIYMTVGELAVTLIEIFVIKYGLKVSRGKAILASILCNLCSYLIGLLIL